MTDISIRIEIPEGLAPKDAPGFVDVRLVWDTIAHNLARPILESDFAETDHEWPMVYAMLAEAFTNKPWSDQDVLSRLLKERPELRAWLLDQARRAIAEAHIEIRDVESILVIR